MRVVRQIILWSLAIIVVVNIGFAAALINPTWAFSLREQTDRLAIYSARPLSGDMRAFAEQVMADLDAGPLPPAGADYRIFITQGGWRDRLFFFNVPFAGGVIYPLYSGRNVFLTGADLAGDRLIKGDEVIPPPRTLSYYARHELTHLAQRERLDTGRYIRCPVWLIEGLAEYVALGPADPALREAVAVWRAGGDRQEMMRAHGSYPEHRLAVTDALVGTTVPALLQSC